MAQEKADPKSSPKKQNQGTPEWTDHNKLQALKNRRLAQKNCYTEESRELIERVINKVQAL